MKLQEKFCIFSCGCKLKKFYAKVNFYCDLRIFFVVNYKGEILKMTVKG